MEMVGAQKRQYASILLQVFFSLGYLLTALIAYLVTDWRNLQFAISVPGLFFLVYWWSVYYKSINNTTDFTYKNIY